MVAVIAGVAGPLDRVAGDVPVGLKGGMLGAPTTGAVEPAVPASQGIRPPKGSIGCEEAGGEGGREEGRGGEEPIVQSPFAPGRARR
jgi:hypothetical protein